MINHDSMDIRTIRLAKGIGLRELAACANVSQTELSKCERGLVLPNEDFFAAISRVLAVPAIDLRQTHSRLLELAIPGEGYTTAVPGESYIIDRQVMPASQAIHVLDLFCGTGGFSHGFEQAGSFQVTAGLDLLPDRVQTFARNHRTATAFCGDIMKVSIDALSRAALNPLVVIGGPPCQGFSSLRPFRTLTEKDPRNNLIEYFALVVNSLRPTWFVIENVVGLITHKKGEILHSIIRHFGSIGYKVDWQVMNTALYGLPQRRERLIIVGNLLGRPFRWPSPSHYFNGRSMAGKRYGQSIDQLPLFGSHLAKAITVMEAIHDLPEIQAGESSSTYRDDIIPTDYEKAMRGTEKVLTLHESTRHSDHMLKIIRSSGHNRNALPKDLTSSGFSSSYSRLEPDLPSVTLTVNFVHPASNKCIHPFQDRALTPREGARLQGFEDSYHFCGKRSEIVKQIGNAVPPVLGKIIGDAILRQT